MADQGKSPAKWNARAKKKKRSDRDKRKTFIADNYKAGNVVTVPSLREVNRSLFPDNGKILNFLEWATKIGIMEVVPDSKPKSWKVLKQEVNGNSDDHQPSTPGVPPERDPADKGDLRSISTDKTQEALQCLLFAFRTKKEVMTLIELQERCEFFRDFSWDAIRQWIPTLKSRRKRLVEVRANTNAMKTGRQVLRLTDAGKVELQSLRRAEKKATEPTKTTQKDVKMKLLALPGEVVVQGVVPAGFSSNPTLCQESIKLFKVLSGQMGVVSRELFVLALRWKYQWGEKVKGNAVGRVVYALINQDRLRVSEWGGAEGTANKADILVLGKGKKKASKPNPKPVAKLADSVELEALREKVRLLTTERDQALTQTKRLEEQRHHWLDRVRVDLEKSFGLTPEDFKYLAASQDSES